MWTYYSFEIWETIAYFLYANGIISFVESEWDEIDISLKDEMMVRVLDYIHDEELRNIKYIYNQ